jgi:anti-anti-sigma factor
VTPQSTIEIEIHTPTSCIVTLQGEHDVASSEAFTMALALARDYTSVLVDLTTCTFIDTTITSAVVAAAAHMRQADRSLELIVPPGARATRRVLRLAGVLPLIPLHATRAAGLASIASAELLRAHRRKLDLRTLSATVERLVRIAEADRARPAAKIRAGTTVLRAHVAEVDRFEAEARRRSR